MENTSKLNATSAIHCALCGATESEGGPACCEDGSLTAIEYQAAYGLFGSLQRELAR